MGQVSIKDFFGFRLGKEETEFRLYAPKVQRIELLLFKDYREFRFFSYKMQKGNDGTFYLKIGKNLKGYFYNYLIDGRSKICDPYSVAASVNSRKSAIVDLRESDPQGFRDSQFKNKSYKSAIIYEMNIKDLAWNLPFEGGPIDRLIKMGFPSYLKDLGVSHVHLMPVNDFISVDERKEKNLDKNNYNWGYDPELYNVVDGSFSSCPEEPLSRIYQLKSLIKAFHDEGIGVVLDVVYNHTYRYRDSNFGILAKDDYYRLKEDGSFSDGSWCGNELKTENPITRKFIIDSLRFWQEEYRVDGFRFDLMGLIDRETLRIAVDKLREKDPNCLIYGEAWTAGDSTLKKEDRSEFNLCNLLELGAFNPFYRDALKGEGDQDAWGYLQGDLTRKKDIEKGIAGSINYDKNHKGIFDQAYKSINYFNAHDNLILTDKLRMTQMTEEEVKLGSMLAISIIMTSQGLAFIHAGNEMLRDKKGDRNSYKSSLDTNGLDWGLKEKNKDLLSYTRDIINLRKDYISYFNLEAGEIRKRLDFYDIDNSNIIAFRIDGLENEDSLLIFHNRAEKHDLKDKFNFFRQDEKISLIFDKNGRKDKCVWLNEIATIEELTTVFLVRPNDK